MLLGVGRLEGGVREEQGAPLRILLVFPFLPYPPDDGGRIGFFNPIKYLSRKHEVSVACLIDGTEPQASIEELAKYCTNLKTYRRAAWQSSQRLLMGTISFPPGASAKYWHRGMGELIREMIAERKPDLVEFHHLNTAIYRDFAGQVPAILREHNVEYKVWERFAENAQGWTERSFARWTAPRVRQYEAEAASKFDRCVVVSEADAVHLREISPRARLEVIPSGVDTEYFYPTMDVEEEPCSMTLTGSFEWKPKQRSLHILLTQIFPRIRAKLPLTKLYVVGKGVPEHLSRLAQKIPGVILTGAVSDVRPYIARSTLLVNYLESGGGIALKVLEAMAMRKPVLCNSLGCEGLAPAFGKGVCVADGVEEFSSAAVRLLEDQGARHSLAEDGYQKVLKGYSWNVVASLFQDFYQNLTEARKNSDSAAQSVRAQCAC